MIETETREAQEIEHVITQAVDESVTRAFKRYAKASRISKLLQGLTTLLIIALIGVGVYLFIEDNTNKTVAPVEQHDLTLENNGIFGFTVVDFQEPVLGAATRQRILLVEEQEVYVNTTITEAGLFSWEIFNKQQPLTIHGTGQYTIDLADITSSDISLNEDTYELTIKIPHAELHDTSFDPSKTEIGDTKNGWLAFGDIKLTAEQQKEFEVAAEERLERKLSESARFEEADRFAKLAAYETYQPIIKLISPAYKVIIEFQ